MVLINYRLPPDKTDIYISVQYNLEQNVDTLRNISLHHNQQTKPDKSYKVNNDSTLKTNCC